MISKNQKGVTLAELLVAMTLSLIVLGAVYSTFRVQSHTVKVQGQRMEAQEYARAALDIMVREIRNIGYFRNRVPCTTPGNTNGIVTASNTTIRFVYDLDYDGFCVTSGEDITYTYDSVSKNISRTVNVGPNPGPTENLTNGNMTAFSFTYFDANEGATTTLASIKRVRISLTVTSKSTDSQFGGAQTIAMDSNVDLRNRCLNSTGPC
jgi:type IV pilus assembly protein PilW